MLLKQVQVPFQGRHRRRETEVKAQSRQDLNLQVANGAKADEVLLIRREQLHHPLITRLHRLFELRCDEQTCDRKKAGVVALEGPVLDGGEESVENIDRREDGNVLILLESVQVDDLLNGVAALFDADEII